MLSNFIILQITVGRMLTNKQKRRKQFFKTKNTSLRISSCDLLDEVNQKIIRFDSRSMQCMCISAPVAI